MTEIMINSEMSETQRAVAERIDGLDLEPIAYKLMHPEPGETAMPLADADQLIAAYRCFLKLCAWYPDESIVPSKMIDEVWHAHILDTAKYAADSDTVFGHFVHHFPYFGLRGPDDEAALRASFGRTRELFGLHFGIDPGTELVAGRCSGTGNHCDELECDRPGAPEAAADCHVGGGTCRDGNGAICNFEAECEKRVSALDQPRPRPDRSAAVA